MKRRLFAIMFAVTMFTVLSGAKAWGQTSQAISVDVPFAFTTNKKVHPAGRYLIESLGQGRVLWKIRGTGAQPAEFLLATSRAGTTPGALRVTFRRYGDQQFLAGFKTAAYEVNLPTSRREKTLRMERAPIGQAEVINLDTITAGSR